MKTNISRRNFLLATTAGVVLAGAGSYRFWEGNADGRALWVEAVVRNHLPGVKLDEPSLAQFVQETMAGDLFSTRTRRAALFAQQTFPWITARVPKVRNGLEKLERRVLTDYLMGSNFFRVPDPKQTTVIYYGAALACANPFASLT